MGADLRSFLERCEAAGVIVHVADPVRPSHEVSARLYREADRVVMFDRVEGYAAPIVAGLCASRDLIAGALGTDRAGLTRTISKAIDAPAPYRTATDAPFTANAVDRPDLGAIVPLVRFYPEGDRRYATGTIVIAPSERGANLSFHRLMLIDGNRFAVRVVPRHLHRILEARGGRVEVAVVCGVHPAVEVAAATSGPPELDELRLASVLLGGDLDCVDLDGIPVPAHAELVLRGRFTGETAQEGPFVDLTGTYDVVRPQPVLVVDRLYHRDGWRYRTILPGGNEHRLLMGLPQEPRILRIVANAVPGAVGAVLTGGGCGWLHAVVSIRKAAEGDGRNAGLAALAAHPSLKRVVVVDDDVDPTDAAAVEWAVATRFQPDRDLFVIRGAHGSSLDPSRDLADETTAKWILDATIPLGRPRREFERVKPVGT